MTDNEFLQLESDVRNILESFKNACAEKEMDFIEQTQNILCDITFKED